MYPCVLDSPFNHEKESEVNTMQCALCNEYIDDNEFVFDEAFEIDGEYWHAECYAEYFGEELEEAV